MTEFNNKLGYLSIPIAIQVNLSPNFYIEAGPQASFLLSNKNEFNLKDENSFDLAIFGGAGLRLFKNLNFGARYVAGTKNVYPQFDSKNRTVQAFLEIKF